MMLSCTCTHSLGSLLEQEGEGWEDHPRESEGPDSESEGRWRDRPSILVEWSGDLGTERWP